MRFTAPLTCLALFAATPVLAAPFSACESKTPATALEGCTAILEAGQDMQSLDFEAYSNRAQAELSLGQPQAARRDALAGVALNPANGPIYLTLAKAYVALDQTKAAKAALDTAMSLTPNDPGPYILLGEMHLAANDWKADVAAQNQALALNPNDADIYMARAIAELEGSQPKVALADVNHAAALGSTDPRVHLVRGFVAAGDSDWKTAALEETQYLYAVPDNPLVLAAFSQAEEALGHNQQALQAINHAIALVSTVPDFYLQRASVEDRMGQFSDEMADLTTVISNAGTDKDLLYHTLLLRAGAEQQAKLFDLAMKDAQRAVALAPDKAPAYTAEAVLARTMKDNKAAIADDAKAIDRDNKYIPAYEDQAVAYSLTRDYANAVKDETQVLRLAPNSAPDLNNRCWFLALEGKLPEAQTDCLASLKLAPHQPATLDSTGYVYLQLKRYQEAIHYYDEGLKLDPKMSTSLYGRALAEQALGETKQADADMAQAKKDDPKIKQDFGH